MRLFKLFLILAVSIILQIGATRIADEQRGYDATVGEVLVFPVVMFLGYKLAFDPDECLFEDDEEEYDA